MVFGFIAVFMVISSAVTGETPVSALPDMTTVTASVRETPPAWAVMERHLMKTMEAAVPVYVDRFTLPGGTLYGGGPWDDLYEMFYNWALFYSMGAGETLLTHAVDEYNALTRHCTVYADSAADYHHQLYREFPRHDDWFHISEGIMLFYDLALGDPTIPENIDRARRFAGFYMNEDPECTGNFDPIHKLIPAINSGSQGPVGDFGASYMLNFGHASLYPVVKDLETDWEKNPQRREEINKRYDEIVNWCDVPVNLAATGLVTNAYLYTGDEKYKKWVLDYVDAWMKRIEENNGILPDNIGRTGKIGEYREGQWWGGFFGWTGRYSVHMIYSSLCVASECAYLVSGDPKYLNLLRSQVDVLLENARYTKKEKQMLVPYKYGPDGWFSYRPPRIYDLAHLWHNSMDPEDWKRIEKVMAGHRYYPLAYSGTWGQNMLNALDTGSYIPEKPFDWTYIPIEGDRNIDFPTEYARLMYYAGKNPDWPEKILAADFCETARRMDFMRNDTRDISDINADDLYPNNPVITKGLTQVMFGAPQTIYNGGLLQARVRYFDTSRMRPGLPEDVAALVEELGSERTVVKLINLSVVHTRRLIIQAGAFGEHEFTTADFDTDEKGVSSTGGKTVTVNSRYLAVELPPATSVRLDIGTRRFVNKPSYAFPWHGKN